MSTPSQTAFRIDIPLTSITEEQEKALRQHLGALFTSITQRNGLLIISTHNLFEVGWVIGNLNITEYKVHNPNHTLLF